MTPPLSIGIGIGIGVSSGIVLDVEPNPDAVVLTIDGNAMMVSGVALMVATTLEE